MIGQCTQGGDYMMLVVDPYTVKLVSSCCRIHDLNEVGIAGVWCGVAYCALLAGLFSTVALPTCLCLSLSSP